MDTNSLHLTFVYVSAILNCVSAIRSGTDQLSTLRITFKAPRVLVALKGFAIVRNTRQAKHGSTTTGKAKHVGIAISLWKTFTLYFTLMTRFLLLTFYFTRSLHFTPGLQSAVCILTSVCILPPVCSLQSAVCILPWLVICISLNYFAVQFLSWSYSF